MLNTSHIHSTTLASVNPPDQYSTAVPAHCLQRRMLMPLSSQDAIEEYLPEIRQLAEETLVSEDRVVF
jgi:cytochrome P450